jgi:hypothetical protein
MAGDTLLDLIFLPPTPPGPSVAPGVNSSHCAAGRYAFQGVFNLGTLAHN